MSDDPKVTLIEEYYFLLGAVNAYFRGDQESYDSFVDDIRLALSEEYNDNIDEKIRRWVEVTREQYFHPARPVDFYIQAKMLYRDGFFEAAIMMSRSISEMICYDLLNKVKHPFGPIEQVERQNFRILVKFLFNESMLINQRTFDLLNKVYDIGNDYVHPKSKQEPNNDARACLMAVGEAVSNLYGLDARPVKLETGLQLQSAYAAFPAIGPGLYIVAFKTPEAAEKDLERWGKRSESPRQPTHRALIQVLISRIAERIRTWRKHERR